MSTTCCAAPNYKVDGNFTICTHCGNTKQIAFSESTIEIPASEMKVSLAPLNTHVERKTEVIHPEEKTEEKT